MQFIITTTVVILLVGVASSCPSVCRCQEGGLVDCSRKRLDSIPTDLPHSTYELYVWDYNKNIMLYMLHIIFITIKQNIEDYKHI
jgi:hypothetical protein